MSRSERFGLEILSLASTNQSADFLLRVWASDQISKIGFILTQSIIEKEKYSQRLSRFIEKIQNVTWESQQAVGIFSQDDCKESRGFFCCEEWAII